MLGSILFINMEAMDFSITTLVAFDLSLIQCVLFPSTLGVEHQLKLGVGERVKILFT